MKATADQMRFVDSTPAEAFAVPLGIVRHVRAWGVPEGASIVCRVKMVNAVTMGVEVRNLYTGESYPCEVF